MFLIDLGIIFVYSFMNFLNKFLYLNNEVNHHIKNNLLCMDLHTLSNPYAPNACGCARTDKPCHP